MTRQRSNNYVDTGFNGNRAFLQGSYDFDLKEPLQSFVATKLLVHILYVRPLSQMKVLIDSFSALPSKKSHLFKVLTRKI